MTQTTTTVNGVQIDWNCEGNFSFTTGFSATRWEKILAGLLPLLLPIALYATYWRTLGWTGWQIVVAAFLAVDMAGGVLTNSLGSMKRFLHSDQELKLSVLAKLVRSDVLFPAVHLQLFLVPACFEVSWGYAVAWYTIMIASVALLHFVPIYLKRVVALCVVIVAIILSEIALLTVTGLAWLGPVFIIKLVLAHAVREEPYRPTPALQSSIRRAGATRSSTN